MPLTEFTVYDRWWDGLWGGGHTAETDPSRRGWRAQLSHKGSKVLLIGQRMTAGCASVMRLSDGRLHVCVYDDATPETIAAAVREGRPTPIADCVFVRTDTPGWGLYVLDEIARCR